jgi:hypothetical protein
MRLRTLGAVCATSAAAVPITAVPFALAQDAAPDQGAAQQPPEPAATPPADVRAAAVTQLADRHVHLARRYHRLLGDPLSRPERAQLHARVVQLPPATLRARTSNLREDIRRLRRHLDRKRNGGAPDVPIPPQLKGIAECESHGNPRAISTGGTYRGKYQFSFSTWRSVGGRGDPARASETEQDRRAAKLYRSGGPGHWPVCGR